MSTEYTVFLPWERPPLTLNQRQHWSVKRRLAREIRDFVGTALMFQYPQPVDHVRIELHYTPKDKRRRDPDNLVPVLKHCTDGVVDSGLIPDDTPDYCTALMPIIHKPQPNPIARLYLRVIVTGGTP